MTLALVAWFVGWFVVSAVLFAGAPDADVSSGLAFVAVFIAIIAWPLFAVVIAGHLIRELVKRGGGA